MRGSVYVLTLIIWMISCNSKQPFTDIPLEEKIDCSKGLMKSAWYEHGIDESIPDIKGLNTDFLILVDTNFRSKNFISFDESYSMKESNSLDTSDLQWVENWDKLSVRQKLECVKEERKKSRERADSIHAVNNQGQQQIWIINNSNDTVTIQMQDWLFICILQARTKTGQWLPIEFWRLSTCGNSYYPKVFLPGSANSFITVRPNEGNFKTKLRYKLLGTDSYFYSNEFDGKIEYCRFVEDSSSYDEETKQPHFKLDSLVDFTF